MGVDMSSLLDETSNQSLDLLAGEGTGNATVPSRRTSQSSMDSDSAPGEHQVRRQKGQSPPPSQHSASRLHHSTKAFSQRFLDDSEQDAAAAPADFHMSQLKFPTLGSSTAPSADSAGRGIFDDDVDLLAEETPASSISRYNNNIRSKRAAASSASPSEGSANVFASRQDLREVDQVRT